MYYYIKKYIESTIQYIITLKVYFFLDKIFISPLSLSSRTEDKSITGEGGMKEILRSSTIATIPCA